jgi:hypothetical protein
MSAAEAAPSSQIPMPMDMSAAKQAISNEWITASPHKFLKELARLTLKTLNLVEGAVCFKAQ